MPYDWRPPTQQDWTCLHTLLRDVRIQLETDAEAFEQAEKDLRAIGGDNWSIGIGRYPIWLSVLARTDRQDDRARRLPGPVVLHAATCFSRR